MVVLRAEKMKARPWASVGGMYNLNLRITVSRKAGEATISSDRYARASLSEAPSGRYGLIRETALSSCSFDTLDPATIEGTVTSKMENSVSNWVSVKTSVAGAWKRGEGREARLEELIICDMLGACRDFCGVNRGRRKSRSS